MRALYTTTEVALILRVSPKSVVRWCDLNMLEAFKTPGGTWRVKRETLVGLLWPDVDLDQLIEAHRDHPSRDLNEAYEHQVAAEDVGVRQRVSERRV